MKKIVFFIFLFSAVQFVIAQEQHTYGPVLDNPFVTQYEYQGLLSTTDHLVGVLYGQQGGYIFRNFDFWEWTEQDIHIQAELTSFTITFQAHRLGTDHFKFGIFNLNTNYQGDNYNYYDLINTEDLKVYTGDLIPTNNMVYFNKTISDQNDPFFIAVKNAIQSGQHYLALGIRLDPESSATPWWVLSEYGGNYQNSTSPTINLTIHYTTPNQYFQFINKIQDTENYGQLILNHNLSNPLNSGANPFLPYNSTNVIRTDELPFLYNWNSSGTTQKDNYWDLTYPTTDKDYNLNRTFISNSTSPHTLKAWFNSTVSATIKNSLEGTDLTGGTLSFKDPWYYFASEGDWYQSNQFKPYSSPLNLSNNSESSYGGVFPDQGGQNWTPPYYNCWSGDQLIDVPNIGTRKFYFQGWNSTGANLHFYGNEAWTEFTSSNAMVKAVLKGVGLSNDISGYWTNGQRKIVRTQDGYLHSVYRSLNKIWYEISTDGGTTWDIANNHQSLIEDGDDFIGSPSIDYCGNTSSSTVFIAYQSFYHGITIKIFKKVSGVYTLQNTMQDFFGTDVDDCTPVVSINQAPGSSDPTTFMVV